MGISQNIITPMYRGKTTSCHSQALLTAFFGKKKIIEPWMFENFTTIPFGIKHNPSDPNRLLNCYLDPDFGLDRALEILQIPYEVEYWKPGTDGSDAIRLLREWCSESPVVLGPLNMDGLSYLFHKELYYRVDHYIIALKAEDTKIQICDPEGFILVFLSIDDLLDAWRGDRIPEGRGEFVMRRVLEIPKLRFDKKTFRRVLQLAIQNLTESREQKLGGANALLVLANQQELIGNDPSLKRGMTYVIPTRIQRIVFTRIFVQTLRQKFPIGAIKHSYLELLEIIDTQIRLFSEMISNILNKVQNSLENLKIIADLENHMIDLYEDIGDKI